jgi:DNA invertase Pin-like site-specific DNA recombinase
MITVLGSFAEFERELIRARTSEGRARAVARGVKLGRRYALNPEQRRQALARLNAGRGVTRIARTLNVASYDDREAGHRLLSRYTAA